MISTESSRRSLPICNGLAGFSSLIEMNFFEEFDLFFLICLSGHHGKGAGADGHACQAIFKTSAAHEQPSQTMVRIWKDKAEDRQERSEVWGAKD